MPVDVTKIKAGDKITVELIVAPGRYRGRNDSPVYADVSLGKEFTWVVAAPEGFSNTHLNQILASSIVGHTPKPPEIKAGMVFDNGSFCYDVVFVDDLTVCYRNTNASKAPGAISLKDFRIRLQNGIWKLVEPV